jgi:hypothetical protein
MIIDNFGVFFNDVAAASSMTSAVVNVSPYAGRDDPTYITLLTKGPNAGKTVTYTVKIQQSEDNSTFTDVETFTLSKPDAQAVLEVVRLPLRVTQPFVRLSAAATVASGGSLTGVTLFAAVTRDHFAPYSKGQFINRGTVVA